jgi:carbon-monoxide dehydrogenase medium subunit
MFPRSFAYLAPRTVEEVLAALEAYPESKVLAGGQSLIPILKMRLVDLTHVIDLRHLPWKNTYRDGQGHLHIGALVPHRAIEEDIALGVRLPILHDAAHHIADLQVRTLGTVGGALAEADPAGDWPAVMLALNAEVVVRDRQGQRRMPVRELFVDPYTPNLTHTQLLEEVIIPAEAEQGSGAYLKFERRAGSFAIASVAAQLRLAEDNTVLAVGLGLGGVGLTPIKATAAEAYLLHQPLTPERMRKAAQLAMEQAAPLDDIRGSADYKREMVGVLTQRALEVCRLRQQGRTVEARVF